LFQQVATALLSTACDRPVPASLLPPDETNRPACRDLLTTCRKPVKSTACDRPVRFLAVYNVTHDQRKTVEKKTRDQADSRLWFRHRTGRVTASRFKAACHTNKETPSRSLIMSICYPELNKFSTTATKWGCNHEGTAK
jgi:hypothetical protein